MSGSKYPLLHIGEQYGNFIVNGQYSKSGPKGCKKYFGYCPEGHSLNGTTKAILNKTVICVTCDKAKANFKQCTKCKQVKPNSEYRCYKGTKFRPRCRVCENKRRKYNEQDALFKDPTRILYKGCKDRARQKGLDFDLTRAYLHDLYQPNCPVLGVPLSRAEGRAADASPSLDRIDSTKGYVQGNVRIISWRANKLKNNASLDELKALVRYMEQHNQAA